MKKKLLKTIPTLYIATLYTFITIFSELRFDLIEVQGIFIRIIGNFSLFFAMGFSGLILSEKTGFMGLFINTKIRYRAKIKRMTIYGGIAGILMGALNILVLSQANSSSFPEWTKYATDPYNIFILSLRAGLVEETVFRLFLFPVSVWGCALIRKRAESISKIEIMIGAVISSALFGIIHNSGCILAMIMGLLLTAVYYKAGWESCVIAHFITDFIPFMIVF